MNNPIQVGLALDAMPPGAQIVATGIENGKAYGILFTHAESVIGNKFWAASGTNRYSTSGELVAQFDDFVVTFVPDTAGAK